MRPVDAFAALGLRPGASRRAVDAAFRKAVKAAHPDVGGDATVVVELLEARRVARRAAMSTAGDEGHRPLVVVSRRPCWLTVVVRAIRRRRRPPPPRVR